ncbi:hypothetical protein [Pseudomonas benzenivorans]|uniref:Uncharacterized protein n=1 Tax=Pseudomonas benzenivorans TaxID=556533 RepID=A0ABY5HBS2_9PSED|nr:hypothetical protein [Pseudomonas benzenivorans]UTW08807.1 hypothetical protein KDW96_05685 [Pseudomonas benzenivorans]
MINAPAIFRPASVPGSSLPAASSAAEVRGYLDFQLLMSRMLSEQAPAGAEPAEPAATPASADPDQRAFVTRLQLELGEHLKASWQCVDRLSLAMLADACDACARVSAPAATLALPAPQH